MAQPRAKIKRSESVGPLTGTNLKDLRKEKQTVSQGSLIESKLIKKPKEGKLKAQNKPSGESQGPLTIAIPHHSLSPILTSTPSPAPVSEKEDKQQILENKEEKEEMPKGLSKELCQSYSMYTTFIKMYEQLVMHYNEQKEACKKLKKTRDALFIKIRNELVRKRDVIIDKYNAHLDNHNSFLGKLLTLFPEKKLEDIHKHDVESLYNENRELYNKYKKEYEKSMKANSKDPHAFSARIKIFDIMDKLRKEIQCQEDFLKENRLIQELDENIIKLDKKINELDKKPGEEITTLDNEIKQMNKKIQKLEAEKKVLDSEIPKAEDRLIKLFKQERNIAEAYLKKQHKWGFPDTITAYKHLKKYLHSGRSLPEALMLIRPYFNYHSPSASMARSPRGPRTAGSVGIAQLPLQRSRSTCSPYNHNNYNFFVRGCNNANDQSEIKIQAAFKLRTIELETALQSSQSMPSLSAGSRVDSLLSSVPSNSPPDSTTGSAKQSPKSEGSQRSRKSP